MGISGINRLLSLARKLVVQPTRSRSDPRVEREPGDVPDTRADQKRGVRVSLSTDANELVGVVKLIDVQQAMNAALERRGRDLEVAVMARTAELFEPNQELEELTTRDGLTGLLNRRAMTVKLAELHTLTRR